MQLSDAGIAMALGAGLVIEPFYDRHLQPASYDVTADLGDLPASINRTAYIVVAPLQSMLISTVERVEIPADLCAQVDGKSTWARRGLIVHHAGFVDPGFRGNITLELFNASGEDIHIWRGDRIAQLRFFKLDQPALRPYGHPDLGSHYQDQVGITGARFG